MPGSEAPRVAVIIAYYQREPGLLLRAVKSALAQSAGLIHIVVVDDGSPIAAAGEISLLPAEARRQIEIICQPNAGPGAARNRGLAAATGDADFVAFLDSDDEWVPSHIERALAAFDAGADFYFTDYIPVGSARSTLDICGLTPNDLANASVGDNLHHYGKRLIDALLSRAPVGTSTVVFRRSILGDHRFPVQFDYGEDVCFWMLLTERDCNIVFTEKQGAFCGRGVNAAAGVGWGTPTSLRRMSSEIRLHDAISKLFELTKEQRAWSKAWRDEVRKSFITSFLHLVRHRKPVGWRCVLRFLRGSRV